MTSVLRHALRNSNDIRAKTTTCPAGARGFVDTRGSNGQQDLFFGTGRKTAVKITGYFVGVGRIRFEFMDWIKQCITGFLDPVHRLAY
jgi:hypothetical protein